MLTLVLLCGGGTHAVGQVKDAQPVQTQNPGTEVADPTELLGDTPMTRSTLAPLLGSPQAIVLDTAEPFANSATAADSSQTSDATRDQFNAHSIRNLRKPISDIRIVAVDAADRVRRPAHEEHLHAFRRVHDVARVLIGALRVPVHVLAVLARPREPLA